MSCEQCLGLEKVFGERTARSDLRRYRRKGPARTTRDLVDALLEEGAEGATVLDIGGGVGAIPLALLRSGASSVTLIDASAAYLAAAREEGARQGQLERMRFRHADFAAVAAEEPLATIVTLDRVICCYDDVTALVGAAASHATQLLGLVYPRDTWWNRAGITLVNLFLGLTRLGYRSFLHPRDLVTRLIETQGHRLVHQRDIGIWQVEVYRRAAGVAQQ